MRKIGLFAVTLLGTACTYPVPYSEPETYDGYEDGQAKARACNQHIDFETVVECFQNEMTNIDAGTQSRLFFLNETYALLKEYRQGTISEAEARNRFDHIKRQTIVYVQSEGSY